MCSEMRRRVETKMRHFDPVRTNSKVKEHFDKKLHSFSRHFREKHIERSYILEHVKRNIHFVRYMCLFLILSTVMNFVYVVTFLRIANSSPPLK